MSSKGKHGGEEEGGGHSVGLWYVSFSDMITLLLSFFVILTTFSSFSKESLEKFQGAWAYINNYSILPGRNISQDGVAAQFKYVDWAQVGSEKPTEDPETSFSKNPRASLIASGMAQAYHNRRVIYIPSSGLFWGQGCQIIPAGKGHLDLIASLLAKVPCQIVISESSIEGDEQKSLDRCWAIVEYLSVKANVPADRFAIAIAEPAAARSAGGDVMELSLLARSQTQ